MAAALGAMVSGLARLDVTPFEADRQFFSGAVKRDAEAYDGVVAAFKIPKPERGDRVESALHEAAKVPLEVAEEATSLKERLRTLMETTPQKFRSDIETALALAHASVEGAAANVRINLESIKNKALVDDIGARLQKLT
jgi:formiminotetrahydrofolate cyclodeaminase